jgi:hypothetical protein
MGGVAEQLRSDGSAALPTPPPMNFTCDACSARAIYEARLPSGRELLFCGHHIRRHMSALTVQGATVFNREDD